MPSDILGAELLETDPATGARRLRFVPGPIFANILLADEINRTPPKTQSALLEAMQERSVTVAGRTLEIAPPFFVIATQNPIEQEGTYPLAGSAARPLYVQPESDLSDAGAGGANRQRDDDGNDRDRAARLPARDELIALQRLVRQVPASPHVVSYAVSVARASRPNEAEALPLVKKYVEWGAGPRASQNLVLGAKARAVLTGKPAPTANDVRAVAAPVLGHRILRNYAAIADGITPERLIHEILQSVREPNYAG